MKCPIDGSPLKAGKTKNHTGYGCITCNGAWLPKNYIDSIKHTKDFNPDKFFTDLSSKTSESKRSLCPSNCGVLSTTVDSKGISYCTSCSGIWFDENELREMLKRYNNKNSLTAVDIPNTSVGLLDVLGALFK